MGKSLFTIIFLILALVAADRFKTFVKNNKPEPVEQTQAGSATDATSSNAYNDYINGTSTINIDNASTTGGIDADENGNY